jgi:hypothetical protein
MLDEDGLIAHELMFDEDGPIAALPPVVRCGYASPVVTLKNTWAAPIVRPLALQGEARTGGEAAFL